MNLPLILCRLCDQSGNILNPYDPGSVRFSELTSPGTRPKKSYIHRRKLIELYLSVISIEGYVAVSLDGRNLSAPIPFKIVQQIWIYAPKNAKLDFTLNNFVCHSCIASPYYLNIYIDIESLVRSRIVPDSADRSPEMVACIHKTIDAVTMLSDTCLRYEITHLKAQAKEFNAISDGIKRVYTNNDDLVGYGGEGIPFPADVSYYNLYVNGVLQPKVNYVITKGRLEFVTADIPAKGETILLRYLIFQNRYEVRVTDYQYFSESDGQQRIYTNADEIKKYGCHGIPGPEKVSYYNLFVNGVLQPVSNYEVKEGILELKTVDVPQKGLSVILESIIIKDACGRFLRVELYQYDTHSHAQRIYGSGDELSYGTGILEPCQSTYQNLFINAVNQPKVDYRIMEDCLVLVTVDLPLKKTPVSMQSVVVSNHIPSRVYGHWCSA